MWRQMQADVNGIEKPPRETRESRGSTALLILSVFFPRLWLIDITGMSLYWVVRPWYRSSIRSRRPLREHQKFLDGRAIQGGRVILSAERFFQNGRHRFVTGVLCGGMSIGLVWGASVWKARDAGLTLPSAEELFPTRSPSEDAFYDRCLVAKGNTVACDAALRIYHRGY